MSNSHVDPMIPAEVDLRGYGFMPLYGHHLFGSDFNSRVSDAGWRAAITLWWAAWNQVPAASLPNDDAALCRLADLGRDVKSFRKLKDDALHGFVLCSDGRLYHKYLAGLAVEAWARRVKERERKAKYRSTHDRHRDIPEAVPDTGTDHGTDHGTQDGTEQGHTQGRNSREGEGEGEGEGPLYVPMELHGESSAVDNSKPACSDKSETAPPETNGKKYRTPAWWKSDQGIDAKASEMGIQGKTGESYASLKDRIFDTINHGKTKAATAS